ncbi:hypothetical protein AMIS_25680 [Actinoplanes missouriensis 431]|uniref:Uncharacterized protein n=1 Tax=Actinoplanes missouriensis (strain ATCC 14538 / DSM 43046 / CBS 188.64 / JCM 3121 / NBRC 102363 / NCIMB 12654 / NRRL B-3342 / UNCC 431) TaxID=512565 RepID=I0H451_ACTM4|nr:hypothetical protein [Actinoplanes missouriensis]BAL87788.1 hypothetical protein AMIS_25680 [Actinoplanes missouriensis 431]
MVDATRELRWYSGLALILFGLGPAFGLWLVAADGEKAIEWLPVLLAAPINLASSVFVVLSMRTKAPSKSSRRLALAAGLVLLGDTLLFGLRALVT